MKYLNKYANLAAYEADENKGYPNVSVIGDPEGEYEVKYEKTDPCGYDASEWDELDYKSAEPGDKFTMTETLCESGTSAAWESLDSDFVGWVFEQPAQDINWVLTTKLDGVQLEEEVEQGSPEVYMKFYDPDANGGAKAPAREYLGIVTLNMAQHSIATEGFATGGWEYVLEKLDENE